LIAFFGRSLNRAGECGNEACLSEVSFTAVFLVLDAAALVVLAPSPGLLVVLAAKLCRLLDQAPRLDGEEDQRTHGCRAPRDPSRSPIASP
jgi:hypothetical protein